MFRKYSMQQMLVQILQNAKTNMFQPAWYMETPDQTRFSLGGYHTIGLSDWNIAQQEAINLMNQVAANSGITESWSLNINQPVLWSGIGEPFDIIFVSKTTPTESV